VLEQTDCQCESFHVGILQFVVNVVAHQTGLLTLHLHETLNSQMAREDMPGTVAYNKEAQAQ